MTTPATPLGDLAERGYGKLATDFAPAVGAAYLSARALASRLPPEPPATIEPAHVVRLPAPGVAR